MKTPNSSGDPWRAVAVASAVGSDLIVCMFGGYWLGRLGQSWLGGSPVWIVVGIMLGFFVGAAGIVFILRKYTEGPDG